MKSIFRYLFTITLAFLIVPNNVESIAFDYGEDGFEFDHANKQSYYDKVIFFGVGGFFSKSLGNVPTFNISYGKCFGEEKSWYVAPEFSTSLARSSQGVKLWSLGAKIGHLFGEKKKFLLYFSTGYAQPRMSYFYQNIKINCAYLGFGFDYAFDIPFVLGFEFNWLINPSI